MTHSEDAVEGLAAVGKAVAEGAAAHGNSLDALSDDKWVPTEADLRAGRELVAQATEPTSAAAFPWRTGRKVGRTIYAQQGTEPSDDDPLIGVMDTPEIAAEAVLCHNILLSQGRQR